MKYLLSCMLVGLMACASVPTRERPTSDCLELVNAFEDAFDEQLRKSALENENVATVTFEIANIQCLDAHSAKLDMFLDMQLVGMDPYDNSKNILWCNKILSKFNVYEDDGEVVGKATYTKVLEIGLCK